MSLISYRLEVQLCLPANVRICIKRGLNATSQTGSVHVARSKVALGQRRERSLDIDVSCQARCWSCATTQR